LVTDPAGPSTTPDPPLSGPAGGNAAVSAIPSAGASHASIDPPPPPGRTTGRQNKEPEAGSPAPGAVAPRYLVHQPSSGAERERLGPAGFRTASPRPARSNVRSPRARPPPAQTGPLERVADPLRAPAPLVGGEDLLDLPERLHHLLPRGLGLRLELRQE